MSGTPSGIAKLRDWVEARGAEILEPTNEWELLRFKAGDETGIVYTNSKGALTMVGPAAPAHKAMLHNQSWRAAPATKRLKARAHTPHMRAVRKRDGDLCFFCAKAVADDEGSVEHLVARTHGGPNHIANLVLAHHHCNAAAGYLHAAEKVRIHDKAHAKIAISGEIERAAMADTDPAGRQDLAWGDDPGRSSGAIDGVPPDVAGVGGGAE